MLHWTVPFRQLIARVIDMEILFAITQNYYKLISPKIGVNNIYRSRKHIVRCKIGYETGLPRSLLLIFHLFPREIYQWNVQLE